MVDPVSASVLAIGSMAASGIGGIMQAQGATQTGAAQARMYNYQSAVASMNQRIAKQNAAYTRHVGEVSAQKRGMEVRGQEGLALATQAGRGLDVNRGTPKNVRESIHELGLHDQSIIRSDAARRAYAQEIEGVQSETQSTLYRMAATNAEDAARLKAEGTLLGTATSVSSKWLQYGQNFGWGTKTEPYPIGYGSAPP